MLSIGTTLFFFDSTAYKFVEFTIQFILLGKLNIA